MISDKSRRALRLAAEYAKKPPLIYISHLDVARLLSRAIRRARLPVKLTQGFNPHYRVSFKRALKLGLATDGEPVEFYLTQWIDPDRFKADLNACLPEGVRIVSAKYNYE